MHPGVIGVKNAEKSNGEQKQLTLRKMVIVTDGNTVEVSELQLSPLEVCEVARRLLKLFGGPE